jgi:Mg-chelatase subunit ChlD
MRSGWPHLILISAALHATVLLGFFALAAPASAPLPSSNENAATSTLSLQLRQEVIRPHVAASKAVSHEKATAHGVPVVKTEVAEAPTPAQPDSFALKDQSQAHIRVMNNPILSPTPPPAVNPSDGVVFILDISGSMYEPYAGSTRLAIARGLLTDRLNALKDGTPFAIVVYGETARRSGPLVPVTAATRAAATAYANQEFDCGGGTNLPSGLGLAAELHAGSLILFTDGDLNIRRSDLMVQAAELLGERGRCPDLSILEIAPRPETPAKALLEALAEEEGGTCQAGIASESLVAITKKSDADTP